MLSFYSSLIVMFGRSVSGRAQRGLQLLRILGRRLRAELRRDGHRLRLHQAGRESRLAQHPRARAVTHTRTSHVAKPPEGLFDRASVQALERLMIMRERRRLLDHV